MDTPVGLYEILVTEYLDEVLGALDPDRHVVRRSLRAGEAPDRIALHLARVVERAVRGIDEKARVEVGARLARRIVDAIAAEVEPADVERDRLVEPSSILDAILAVRPDGSPAPIDPPLISLLDTTLLTNAPHEPRVGAQVLDEIASAEGIDLIMAFIVRSGIKPLEYALARHCEHHPGGLRVLTTTYTGSTEAAAIDRLAALGADVRVSYDTSTTRLHAKAWLFRRRSGFSTAYIGSSNLTYSAQVDGLEWNLRVSGARNPDVLRKMTAVFEGYWEGGDFRPYDATEFEREVAPARNTGPLTILSPVELRPEPFQERLLEQIEVARARGTHTNLLVAATGTGKTVMAAIDYRRLCGRLPRARLLFVAHRREILEQSLATFRYAVRDATFGELWVDGRRPQDFEHVFASIQSLRTAVLDRLDPTHFDVVVVDEIHHGAAQSYTALLDHVRPRELLGLTATPERSDGQSILSWFGGRITASLRLWDAIDQHRLVPFRYWGVADDLDFTGIPWDRGRGYDVDGLTNLMTADDIWAGRVLDAVTEHAPNPQSMRALGFCVSIEHARFMARVFTEAGVESVAVWGDSPREERAEALRKLAAGRIRVVFSVDLFNEGVDVPNVDTLLLLRPTDSPVLYLQQLGRGLRRAEGKHVCTVIDFVAQHRREFRYDRRLRALLGGSRRKLGEAVARGFPYLPAGCHMAFDRVASQRVLDSIRHSVPDQWPARAAELAGLVGDGHPARLDVFLDETGMELSDVYTGRRRHGWSNLLDAANLPVPPAGPREAELRAAVGRMTHVDDAVRLTRYRSIAENPESALDGRGSECERRIVRMLIASLVGRALPKNASLEDGLTLLGKHLQVRAEVNELFAYLEGRIDHVHTPLVACPNVPLQVHARYTRIEMLAAFGVGGGARVGPWQTGIQYVAGEQADLLAFTLDKSTGGFSPTTSYRDYAVSRELIHWESQGVTREDSDTGQRYQRHVGMGTRVMLFARETTAERAFWFLGPAEYVKHEGERPMAITWRLHEPLPADLFTVLASTVA